MIIRLEKIQKDNETFRYYNVEKLILFKGKVTFCQEFNLIFIQWWTNVIQISAIVHNSKNSKLDTVWHFKSFSFRPSFVYVLINTASVSILFKYAFDNVLFERKKK